MHNLNFKPAKENLIYPLENKKKKVNQYKLLNNNMKRNPNVIPVNKLTSQSQSLNLGKKKKKINVSYIRDTFKGK